VRPRASRRLGELVNVERKEMVRDQIPDPLEPESRQLGEDFPFVRNTRPQHVVECRDAIGRNDQQRRLAGRQRDVVHIAHFPPSMQGETVERCFE
jgi:hypothetical protein